MEHCSEGPLKISRPAWDGASVKAGCCGLDFEVAIVIAISSQSESRLSGSTMLGILRETTSRQGKPTENSHSPKRDENGMEGEHEQSQARTQCPITTGNDLTTGLLRHYH